MATMTLTKPHLRDLILDFYSTHDPQRLRIGVDINGMVDWTMSNGIEQLNQMLSQTYGEGIDLDKRLGTSLDLFKRASTALVDMNQIETEENKRNEIYIRLYKFYEAHDKSKLSGIQKIVDYAMYQGVDALNRKLYMKYHRDLGDEWAFQGEVRQPAANSSSTLHQDYQQYNDPPSRGFPQNSDPRPPPQPFTAGGNKNNYQSFGNEDNNEDDQKYENDYDENYNENENRDDIRQGSYAEEEEMDGPPPPRPMTAVSILPPPPAEEVYVGNQKNKGKQAEEDDDNEIDEQFEDDEDEFIPPPPPQEDYFDPKKINEELQRFYRVNDPGKLDVLEAIADWAMRIGRIEFNKKLLQLYDATLEDVPAEVSAPPLAQKQMFPSKAVPYGFDKSNNNSVPASPAPSKVSSANSNPSKPLPPLGLPPSTAAPALPKPPVPPSPFMTSNPGTSTKVMSAQSNNNFPQPSPMNNGFVPKSPQTNGFSSNSNGPSFNQIAPPMQSKPKPPKPGMPHPSQLEQAPQPRVGSFAQMSFNVPPTPVPQPPVASKGPTRVPISSGSVTESTVFVKGGNNDGKADVVNEANIKACDNYRLDMTGSTFGACVCGAPRSAHKAVANKIAKAASASTAPPVALPMPVQPAAPKPTKAAAPTPVPAPAPVPASFANNNPGNQIQQFGMPYPPQNFSQQQPMQYQYNPQYPQQGGYPGYYIPQQFPPPTQEQAAYYQAYGYQQMPFQGYPGYNPNMPVPGYQMPPNQAPPPVKGGSKAAVASVTKGGACDNYRLDMTGATFGVCVCGYPRVDHVRKL